jgi:hypothetical protein
MALTGNQKAYLQARSGIARSGAIRSNYIFPLFGVVTVGGLDLTNYIQYGSLRITMAINEEPDTCSFDVRLTDSTIQSTLVVGADVLIGLGGPTDNALFGGRVLTAQTTRGPGRIPSVRSVMCADYLQVLDSEYLITYNWPAQSATATIVDLIARFANKTGGIAISTAGVEAALPVHSAIGVSNERFSTVLRRLVTNFPNGGGFYVDPLKVLHVWQGASQPNVGNPAPLTRDNPTLKAFADTVDGAQVRDAVIVEGKRTTAPLGTPGPLPVMDDPSGSNIRSIPVVDASILDPITDAGARRDVRIGTQRLEVRYAYGPWSAPDGTPQTTVTTADVAFNPDPGVEGNQVTIPIASSELFAGRTLPWILIDEQYLGVQNFLTTSVVVPRTGYGAMTGPIQAGATVSVVDSFATLQTSRRYDAPPLPQNAEKVRPQAKEADVVMTVRSTTAPAIHEQLVQDGRYSRAGAAARGAAEVADFSAPLTSIQFETEDLNAKPGRLQAYNLTEPGLTPLVGEAMILTAELTWPVWSQPPRRVCQAARVQAASVVDTWIVDQR